MLNSFYYYIQSNLSHIVQTSCRKTRIAGSCIRTTWRQWARSRSVNRRLISSARRSWMANSRVSHVPICVGNISITDYLLQRSPSLHTRTLAIGLSWSSSRKHGHSSALQKLKPLARDSTNSFTIVLALWYSHLRTMNIASRHGMRPRRWKAVLVASMFQMYTEPS